ncbi:MAG: RAMP superfamily CRISPR-associated protein, partial [Clostridiales bacterium]
GVGNNLVNSFILKYNNKPYIPGSLIKGKLRYNSEMISKLFKDKDNYYECLLSKSNFEVNEEESNCSCPICKMFGGQGNNRGALIFGDNKLDDDKLSELFMTRTGTTIDRYLKTVKNKSLYSIETTIDKLIFLGEINGFLRDETYKKDIFILNSAFNLIDTIGGNQSRGLGFLNKEKCNIKINIDGNKCDLSEICSKGAPNEI